MIFDHFNFLLVHRKEEGKLEESGYKEKKISQYSCEVLRVDGG